jgi:hypothetical protein
VGHSNVWGPAGERLMVIGLTGGIAAGKTEVAGELVRLGACVVDADDIAREVILPGREAYLELLRQLGEHILDDSGRINRTALAEIVFSDAEKRQLVNEITHPAIIAEIVKRVTGYADKLGTDDTPAVPTRKPGLGGWFTGGACQKASHAAGSHHRYRTPRGSRSPILS